MANRFFSNAGHFYAPHNMPVLLDCNFVVDSTNGNGLGIRSLKGPGISAVYMHTSATAAAGNPNPAAGYILIQLSDNYNRLYAINGGFVSPLSGSNVAVDASDALLTIGAAYVITVLGTSTAADWLALGVPAGITPAVGVAFIALATGAGTGNGQVQLPAAAGAGVFAIEAIGDSNLTLAPSGFSVPGPQILLACYKDSSGDAPVLAAPANGSVVAIQLYLSNSSVQVAGE